MHYSNFLKNQFLLGLAFSRRAILSSIVLWVWWTRLWSAAPVGINVPTLCVKQFHALSLFLCPPPCITSQASACSLLDTGFKPRAAVKCDRTKAGCCVSAAAAEPPSHFRCISLPCRVLAPWGLKAGPPFLEHHLISEVPWLGLRCLLSWKSCSIIHQGPAAVTSGQWRFLLPFIVLLWISKFSLSLAPFFGFVFVFTAQQIHQCRDISWKYNMHTTQR